MQLEDVAEWHCDSVSEDLNADAAVIPLRGTLESPAQVSGDGWGTLAEGDGVRVTWQPFASRDPVKTWGPVLDASSSFAKQLTAISERAGKVLPGGPTLFTLELPTGHTLQQLVPAVGGGFRGLVRDANGSRIAGAARLRPVSGSAVGSRLAMGPLVGLMALSIGAEMIARHQQEQVFKAIQRSVEAIERHLGEELEAKLKTAEHALVAANAALLDQVVIPQAVGLASAVTGLSDVRNQAVKWLSRWEAEAAKLPSEKTEISLDRMKEVINAGPGGSKSFADNVHLLHWSLSLDSRAAVLRSTEAAFGNPDRTFDNIEHSVRSRLTENAAVQDRLVRLLLSLAELRVEAGTFSFPGSGSEAANLGVGVARLAHALVRQSPAAPVLGPEGRQVLEIVRAADGKLRICEPGSIASA